MAAIYDGMLMAARLCLLLSVSLCPCSRTPATPAEEGMKPSRQVEICQELLVLWDHLRTTVCLGLHVCFAFGVCPWSKTRSCLL